jgi:ketosteroid isomerase-like protein
LIDYPYISAGSIERLAAENRNDAEFHFPWHRLYRDRSAEIPPEHRKQLPPLAFRASSHSRALPQLRPKGELQMRYILGILILTLSTLGVAFGECTDADKQALEALDRAWSKANETGDRAALMNILSDDYRALPGMAGKSDVINNSMAAFERQKASTEPRDEISYDRYMITCTANTATMTHRTIINTKNGAGGMPETIWVRSIHVFEKRAGKWQVVSSTGNDMDDAMTLSYLELDWTDANLKRDKAWFENNFAPDYVSLSSTTGKFAGKATDIADTINNKGTIEMAESTGMNVNIDRNMAIVTGTYHWKGKDEKGVAYEHRINFIDTWVRRGGRWLVIASAGSQIK